MRQTVAKVAKARKSTKPTLKYPQGAQLLNVAHRKGAYIYGLKLLTSKLEQALDLRVTKEGNTVYCVIWLTNPKTRARCSASDYASGYGYSKADAAIQGALSTIIDLPEGMMWWKVESATAIADIVSKAIGCKKLHIVEFGNW